MKKWTKEEIEKHIVANLQDDSGCGYSAAVVVGGLFKKMYGEYPKIGLSGFQAGAIDSLVNVLPDSLENNTDSIAES
jgi:hypothetical protein